MRIVQSTCWSSNSELPCVGYLPKVLGLSVPLSDLSTLGEYSLSSGTMDLGPGIILLWDTFPDATIGTFLSGEQNNWNI